MGSKYTIKELVNSRVFIECHGKEEIDEVIELIKESGRDDYIMYNDFAKGSKEKMLDTMWNADKVYIGLGGFRIGLIIHSEEGLENAKWGYRDIIKPSRLMLN